MLYPIATDSRVVMDLSGVWKFMIDKEESLSRYRNHFQLMK